MELLQLALTGLEKIIKEKNSFSSVVQASLNGKNNDKFKEVIALIGCSLRHFLILNYRYKSVIDDDNSLPFVLVTSDLLFSKRTSKADAYSFLSKNIANENNYQKLKELIESFLKGEPLIPSSLDPNGFEYLSYKYNTPIWIIKMWRKYYGYRDMRKILMSNSKRNVYFTKVNNEYINQDQFEIANPDFTRVPNKEFYLYNGATKIKKTSVYLNKQIYIYNPVYEEIFDCIDIDSQKGIAIYQDNMTSVLSFLADHLTSYLELDLVANNPQNFNKAYLEKKHYNLKNVHLYQGDYKSLITCISNKVNTFFVFPNSSNFYLLKGSPDHFATFSQDSLDELLTNQFASLIEAAELTEENGHVVYIVPTICKKESEQVIEIFLKEYTNFELVKQRQVFPFDFESSAIFYAILRKKANND